MDVGSVSYWDDLDPDAVSHLSQPHSDDKIYLLSFDLLCSSFLSQWMLSSYERTRHASGSVLQVVGVTCGGLPTQDNITFSKESDTENEGDYAMFSSIRP